MGIWHYDIAGFTVEIDSEYKESPADFINGFSIFKSGQGSRPVLRYRTCETSEKMADALKYAAENKPLHEFDFEDEDTKCFFYYTGYNYIFKMVPQKGPVHICNASFIGEDEERFLLVTSNWEENPQLHLLRFSLWMAFAEAIAPFGAFPIHSSVVVFNQKAVLCLGESGTGKSTHTRLWRQHIKETFLLNDDSPILKVEGSQIMAYGSPWSGKTPCFRREHFPVAAFVRLSQAPQNRIERLSNIASLGALYPSAPPALTRDEYFSDCICETISRVLTSSPVYHLDCLPDEDAALVAKNEIFKTDINNQ